jgi:hypothetical protein
VLCNYDAKIFIFTNGKFKYYSLSHTKLFPDFIVFSGSLIKFETLRASRGSIISSMLFYF